MKFLVFACFCQKWVNAGSKGIWELGSGIPQLNPFTVEADVYNVGINLL